MGQGRRGFGALVSEVAHCAALKTLRRLPYEEDIDLVFIDADSTGYVDYREELEVRMDDTRSARPARCPNAIVGANPPRDTKLGSSKTAEIAG